MPDRDPYDRLRPSILDRLTGSGGATSAAMRRGGVMNLEDLRAAVIRDLEWLLNSEAMSSKIDLEPYPFIPGSVLNYGMPDLAGATISTVRLEDLRAEVKRVIEDFEPRIDKKTLEVHLVEHAHAGFNRIAFEISAEVLAEPLPIPLLLRTDFSLETGLCELHESDGRD